MPSGWLRRAPTPTHPEAAGTICKNGNGEVRTLQAHEMAIAWIDEVIAAKKWHAAEDEAEQLKRRP